MRNSLILLIVPLERHAIFAIFISFQEFHIAVHVENVFIKWIIIVFGHKHVLVLAIKNHFISFACI